MKTLTLTIFDGMWCVTDDDADTLRLFGTDTLPTPYTDRMPLSRVLNNLQALNPGATIKVAR